MNKEQNKNKKLVDKYYWLKPYDDDYDYSFTILDEIPEGWKIAFGELLAEDIQKILDEENNLDFKVSQIKEKYGQLRMYNNGSQRIDDIIDAYSIASENICMYCGKPDVAQSKGYWIWTCCTQCYQKTRMSKNRRYEEEFGNEEYAPMREEYKYTRFSKEGITTHSEDISEYITKIRKRYEERNK